MRPMLPALLLLIGCDPAVGTPPTGLGPGSGACLDADADGICDDEELCAGDDGSGDLDGDGTCSDLDEDDDGDGCPDAVDALPNQFSEDDDGDGVANHCDPCPADNPDDTDGDGVCESRDVCPGGDDGVDTDGDGVPDDCDPCPEDANDDSDGDGVCDAQDLCPGYSDGFDPDGDGVPEWCDPCPGEYPNDSDGDTVCDSVDVCPGGDDTEDLDLDGVPDFCDPCPVDAPDDTDGDGVCDSQDLCPGYVDGAFDADGDGFAISQGDCDDCDPAFGPQNFDIPNSLLDEDCDGVVDGPRPMCDAGLILTDNDPFSAAAAIDLCTWATNGYGLVDARYTRANGTPTSAPGQQSGLLSQFGAIAVQHGDRMLGLSSGRAREASHPQACGSNSCAGSGPGVAPLGFPQNVPGCAGGTAIHDDLALELDLVAPMNAVGFRMRFYFVSFEFPEWVCTTFNDQFVILMDPAPVGAISGNIAVDSLSNPVSVNLAYMEACDPASSVQWAQFCASGCPPLPSPYCPLGDADFAGTGFDLWDPYSGGTAWLDVTAPVSPGQAFSLRLAIWDTGDDNLDSTVLLDDFEWVADPVDVGVQPQP